MTKVDLAVRAVFNEVKSKRDVYYRDLYQLGYSQATIQQAWAVLTNNYDLIRSNKQHFFLTEKGEKFESVDQYLKSLAPKKEINWLGWSGFTLSLILGIVTIYQKYDYRELKEDQKNLRFQYDSLAIQYDSLKLEHDSLSLQYSLYTNPKVLDTLQESQ